MTNLKDMEVTCIFLFIFLRGEVACTFPPTMLIRNI